MWEIKKKFKVSVDGTWNPAIDLAAARLVKLWSPNANLFSKEPHQLTKFT